MQRAVHQMALGARGAQVARRTRSSAQSSEHGCQDFIRLKSVQSPRGSRCDAQVGAGRLTPMPEGGHSRAGLLTTPTANLVQLSQMRGLATGGSSAAHSPASHAGSFHVELAQANKEANSDFRAFLKQHQAVGAGVLSGLGLMLCYGYSMLRQESTDADDDWDEDEADDDDAVLPKYNLDYQLNSKAYDALTDHDALEGASGLDKETLIKYVLEDDPRYDSAREMLAETSLKPMPRPEAYGLWAKVKGGAVLTAPPGLAHTIGNQSVSGFSPTLAVSSSAKTKNGMAAPSSLSAGVADCIPANGRQMIPRACAAPALNHADFVRQLEQKQNAYEADCKRVQKTNFVHTLDQEIVAMQHRCFLKNIPWFEAMPIAKSHLSKTLLKSDPYAVQNPMLAHAAMYARLKRVSYSVHAEGGRFKAHKNSAHPLASHTQIRTASGRVYALLNCLDEKDSKALLEQHGISKTGSYVLGEGMFGKVRLAQDLETGKIVAVKKMFSRRMANFEIEEFGVIPPDDHLVSLFDHAHVRTSDGDNKSYLFMEMVGDVNGIALVEALAKRRKISAWGHQHNKLLKQAVLECSIAVVKLHELGMFHCDIKPENFIISHKAIHLGDYGLSTKDRHTHPGSTLAYNPLDAKYDAEKHDAYALGITFYEFMHGAHPNDIGQPAKTKDTVKLGGYTLEECVAKLRDEDPQSRITVREFIQLPYIQKLMSGQQRAAARELILATQQDERITKR